VKASHFHSLQRLGNRFGEHAVALFSQDVFAAARTIETCAPEKSVKSRANENIYAATAALRQRFSSQPVKKLIGVRGEPESGFAPGDCLTRKLHTDKVHLSTTRSFVRSRMFQRISVS